MYSTKIKAIIYLSIIWIALRIYPALMGWSATGTEVWQARKLLDYGVWRLHGGALSMAAWAGTVAHPEHYFYTHHPYPIFWFVTVIYYFFGIVGVATVMFLLKYLALLFCFLVLHRYFSRPAAFWASVLYAVAPGSILLDGNANSVVVAAVFWPLAVALIVFRFHRKESFTRTDLLLAGATTFLAGQVSWFAFLMAPCLALINSRFVSLRLSAIRNVLTNRVSLAFMIGGILSCLVFFGQVAFYEPNVFGLGKYVALKMGATAHTLPRWHLIGLIPLRIMAFTGIALSFVSVVGCICLARNARIRNEFVAGAALYFVAFAAMVLVLPHFFYTENHIYTWLIFPAAVMAAMLFETISRTLRNLILLSSLTGIGMALMYASVPTISPMARFMGKTFAEHTKKTDFIFTNLKPPAPPYKSSDVTAFAMTKVVADRFIVFGALEPAQLTVARDMVDAATRFQYWHFRSLPIPAALEAELRGRGKLLKTVPIAFPAQTETLADKLRSYYWYSLMKKGRRLEGGYVSSDLIDIYEIDLAMTGL